jgi:Reverse transcriptase (RNA-dependent DNA polymerase)
LAQLRRRLAPTPDHLELVCGDFNAALPPLDDRSLDHQGHPLHAPQRHHLAPAQPPNQAGRALVAACPTNGWVLLTGRLQDVPVSTSTAGGNTRPDHLLVSMAHFQWVRRHMLLTHIHGSDHRPLAVHLTLPHSVRPPRVPPIHGTPLPPCLKWDPELAQEYQLALLEDPDALQHLHECTAACGDNQPEDALAALHRGLAAAARAAGMRTKPRHTRQQHRSYQPWYDQECRQAARALLPGARRGAPQDRGAIATHRTLLRRKQRVWRQQRYTHTMDRMRATPGLFHRYLRQPRGSAPPISLQRFTQHFQGTYQGPGVSWEAPPVAAAAVVLPTMEQAQEIFTEDAVTMVLKRMRLGAAPGVDGLPTACLRCPELREVLTKLLQAVYMSGREPVDMGMALLTPAYKRKGHRWDPPSYRPLALPTALHKLYAGCVHLALHGALAPNLSSIFPTQAGFLPGRNTLLNCFALQHMVQHAHAHRQPLRIALLDVAKAYDTVVHAHLVTALAEVNVPASLIAAVVGMYTAVRYRVAVQGRAGAVFPAGVGVRQGCPLSPLLYNLYTTGLAKHLARECPNVGVALAGDSDNVVVLSYADDQAVVHQGYMLGLQQAVAATEAYLGGLGQALNGAKTVHLVCMPRGTPPAVGTLQVGGVPVAPMPDGIYLGLKYDNSASSATMAHHRAQRMASSAYAGFAALRGAANSIPQTAMSALKVVNTMAMPAGTYGCAVWGLQYCQPRVAVTRPREEKLKEFYAFQDPVEKQRCAVLRHWFHLPHHVPKLALLHELGCTPLVHTYVLQAVRLYNTLRLAGGQYKALLQQCVRDFTGAQQVNNWAAALYRVLLLLLPGGNWRRVLNDLDPIDPRPIKQCLATTYAQYVAAFRPIVAGEGSRLGVYFREWGDHPVGKLPLYLRKSLPLTHVRRTLHFRLGAHHLQVAVGRYQGLARGARLCQRCQQPSVDDERHAVLHCSYPPLAAARATCCAAVFGGGVPATDVLAKFFQEAQTAPRLRRVVAFVADILHTTDLYHEGAAAVALPHDEDLSELEEVSSLAGSEGEDLLDLLELAFGG